MEGSGGNGKGDGGYGNGGIPFSDRGRTKKKERILVKKALLEDPGLVRDGKKSIRVKIKKAQTTYDRQQLRGKGTGRKVIPLDSFLGERKRGVGVVSRNLERTAVEECLKSSYRASEKRINKLLGKETIRRTVLRKGEQAKELEKTTVEEEREDEGKSWQIKDAERPEDSYKKSREGIMRRICGAVFGLRVLYLMADGVGVEQQSKSVNGKRECKVAVILRQNGDQIKKLSTLATWQRVDAFRGMVEWAMLAVYSLMYEVVIVSDGARWIRNMRDKIACLRKAIWILDWFHLKDRTLKTLRILDLEETDQISMEILRLYWLGQANLALKVIQQIPLSEDEEEAEQQRASVRKYMTYIKNQREGIVNYQAYKMKGYVVGSGCVEKMNDQLIKDRMVRQRRIRWSLKGGEAMIQLLTAQDNGRLGEVFI
ncbi:MAG: hypothetical protein U1C97_01705 [Candidatus Gracilibacteria bacterium]|nr:hypothetical protein [Candidatus Gracilibacteria bacterium]